MLQMGKYLLLNRRLSKVFGGRVVDYHLYSGSGIFPGKAELILTLGTDMMVFVVSIACSRVLATDRVLGWLLYLMHLALELGLGVALRELVLDNDLAWRLLVPRWQDSQVRGFNTSSTQSVRCHTL